MIYHLGHDRNDEQSRRADSPNSLERSGWTLAAAMKEKLMGYIEVTCSPSKSRETKGSCRFTLYDTSGRKWEKRIGTASTKSHVLYEGLTSYLDSIKRSFEIDLFTSNKVAVNQIKRRGGLPEDNEALLLCVALRHNLPKYKSITLDYIPESMLKATIRQLQSKPLSVL